MAKKRRAAELLMTDPTDVVLFLVRHGQAGGDPRPGEVGPPLTKLGVRQADRIGRRLAGEKFHHIYSSDMARAYETCAAVRKHHPRGPYTIDRRIREVEGWHLEIARRPRRKGLKARLARERRGVEAFVKKIVKKHRGGDRICIVAHGNLIRLLIPLIFRLNPRQQCFFRTYNTSLTIMTFREGNNTGRKIHLADCIRHLPPALVSNWGPTID